MHFERFTIPTRRGLLATTSLALLAMFAPIPSVTYGQAVELPPIPPELIDDEHVREEFGINEFTTPSIRRIFEDLDALGTLPYDELVREVPQRVSPDRALIALSTGLLIADGFLAVHSEKIEALEDIGKAILDNAKALGAKERIARHASNLLEGSLTGDWETLKGELSATQADVEAEMLLLRDSEVAHLVSLGGWLRAFQIATRSSLHSFAPEKAQLLSRADIAAYYAAGLENLHPLLRKKPAIADLERRLQALREELVGISSREITEQDVKSLSAKADEIVTGLDATLR